MFSLSFSVRKDMLEKSLIPKKKKKNSDIVFSLLRYLS